MELINLYPENWHRDLEGRRFQVKIFNTQEVVDVIGICYEMGGPVFLLEEDEPDDPRCWDAEDVVFLKEY